MFLLDRFGHWLAAFLAKPMASAARPPTHRYEDLAATLRAGDVLLVEGHSRFSTAIKYLTQSSWSHAALYVGDALGSTAAASDSTQMLVEADLLQGVRALPLTAFREFHTRICRPVGLDDAEIARLIAHVSGRIGQQYDLKNVFDLMRYLLPTPPVPTRYRRRMLALGSGDPTKAICSTLIAEAFQSVHYPVLPEIDLIQTNSADGSAVYHELLHIRHHSLFAPRDFDTSPYFDIIKPTIECGFDPHSVELSWERVERSLRR